MIIPPAKDIYEIIEAPRLDLLPATNTTDYIDDKCHPGTLRIADTITATKKGYTLVRRWRRGTWNPDLYPVGAPR